MNLPGHNLAPDFDKPIELLLACHEKILQHCQLLTDLCVYLNSHEITENALISSKQVYRYFSQSAVHHHLDEEQDLFPLLITDSECRELINTLKDEHETLEKYWQLFANIILAGKLEQLASMIDTAREFQQLHQQHIQRENRQLFPLAAIKLDQTQLKILGKKMKARRQMAN